MSTLSRQTVKTCRPILAAFLGAAALCGCAVYRVVPEGSLNTSAPSAPLKYDYYNGPSGVAPESSSAYQSVVPSQEIEIVYGARYPRGFGPGDCEPVVLPKVEGNKRATGGGIVTSYRPDQGVPGWRCLRSYQAVPYVNPFEGASGNGVILRQRNYRHGGYNR
ncbi:MAG: hypothetical protein HGA90_02330 [Alphaproteobacteria bacterium]|nr:hypothetical protein [Alphaproteobacteria bacterium]